MTIDALQYNKVLKSPGPLERLFASSSSAACILDFLILAAQKGQYYSESEIARYSGVSLKSTKAVIFNLQRLGLVKERVMMVTTGKKRKNKAYAFGNEDNSSLSKALANLVLILTDMEVRNPHPSTATELSTSTTGQDLPGDVVRELIEAGIIKLPGSRPKDDNHK